MVDIQLDEFTDCLVERKTGKIINTKYVMRTEPIKENEYNDWKFNWSTTQRNGYTIYELFAEGSDIVQGRISLKMDGGVADIDIVESAPHNYGNKGQFMGVGGHLFAIACQCSLEAGCDGVVTFTSKSDLVEYYKKALNAVEIMPRRLVIFEKEAQILLDKYIRK